MDFEFSCSSIDVTPDNSLSLTCVVSGASTSQIVDELEISDILEHVDTDDLLGAMLVAGHASKIIDALLETNEDDAMFNALKDIDYDFDQ